VCEGNDKPSEKEHIIKNNIIRNFMALIITAFLNFYQQLFFLNESNK